MKIKNFLTLLAALAVASSSFGQLGPKRITNTGWTDTTPPDVAGIAPFRKVDFTKQNHSARISAHVEEAQRKGNTDRYLGRMGQRDMEAEARFFKKTGLRWKSKVMTLNTPAQMENYFRNLSTGGHDFIWGYTSGQESVVVMLNPKTKNGECGRKTVEQDDPGFTYVTPTPFFVVESIEICGNENRQPIVCAFAPIELAIPLKEAKACTPQKLQQQINLAVNLNIDVRVDQPAPAPMMERLPEPVRTGWGGVYHGPQMEYRSHAGITLTIFKAKAGKWEPCTPPICTDPPGTDVTPPPAGPPIPPTTPPNPVENPRPDPIVPNPGPGNGPPGPGNGGVPITRPPPGRRNG